jgi:putative transposase
LEDEMGRGRRAWISEDTGSYHIISRVVGDHIWFSKNEKEYFLKLLEVFASGFFVKIHSFCIMGNHFHILATGLEHDARYASRDELIYRYKQIYGEKLTPPEGTYESDGTLIPDEDGGTERLRARLGSISRFVQELKQSFSRWYNKKHGTKGYLWRDRFKGILVHNGISHLGCSIYNDLNPVRAGLTKSPEKYRWCSLGLQARDPKRAAILCNPKDIRDVNPLDLREFGCSLKIVAKLKEMNLANIDIYRLLVYRSGGVEKTNKGNIPTELLQEIEKLHGQLGFGESFRYKIKNFSEGIAIGSQAFIAEIQNRYNRKFIRPRSFIEGSGIYTTRVLGQTKP